MILTSAMLAFQNVKSHVFHTLLSILGVIIGVASLVAILSLIDGMEKFARDQISNTTSIQAMTIQTNKYKSENGIRIVKDDFDYFTYEKFKKLTTSIPDINRNMMQYRSSDEVIYKNTKNKIITMVSGTSFELINNKQLVSGQLITVDDTTSILINQSFLKLINESQENVNNQTIRLKDKYYTIAGVLKSHEKSSPEIFLSIKSINHSFFLKDPPNVLVELSKIEKMDSLKSKINHFLETNFKHGKRDFVLIANDQRLKQAAKGFQLFRLIMGLIVGISVIVGGIGVMNVLLISVTERTSEIGVRKALGAKKKDIILQYLAESITISALGSIVGLILGILGTYAAIPIIKAFLDLPFQASFTLNTLVIISIVSVFIGIVFGTYPAIRASRLDPVEAMRYE